MHKNLTNGKKSVITFNGYKLVTKNDKGVIIIGSISTKVIAALFAMMFFFGTAVSAFAADEPLGANAVAVQSTDVLESRETIEYYTDKLDGKNLVSVEKITDESATLRWEKSSMSQSYRVRRYDAKSDSWKDHAIISGPILKLKNLKSNTNYQFCVLNTETDAVVGVASFKTKTRPSEVWVEDVTSKSITLAFSAESNATLQLYRKQKGGKYSLIGEVNPKKTYTDKKVKSATTYYYKVKAVLPAVNGGESKVITSKEKKVTTLLKMGLPKVSGKTKTYAYYTAVTARRSPQYKLLRSAKCYTDKKTGIRMVDDCYCVALGSYYGSKIGTKYRITFSTGKAIKVILCDQKANRHTDSKNQYAVINNDIMEFYVEKSKIPSGIRGDYGKLPQFSGSIVSIEKYI